MAIFLLSIDCIITFYTSLVHLKVKYLIYYIPCCQPIITAHFTFKKSSNKREKSKLIVSAYLVIEETQRYQDLGSSLFWTFSRWDMVDG